MTDIHFLNTHTVRWYFLLADQVAHLITHKLIKFRAIQIKAKLKFVAGVLTVRMK